VKIWIDADACPGSVKEILYRASGRLNIPICLVANADLNVPHSPLITAVRVPKGFDVADNYIAREMAPEDIVITADIPLAASIVEKGAVALDPRGELYSEENVRERLSIRNFMHELRAGGLISGGPPPMKETDHKKFATALDRLLTKKMKGAERTPPDGG
jgi:hypothetical protein|tara:strand:+ start:101 stop:580 length:480 start_codon:yes stop_codon:yes gene_type:complete